MGFDFKRALRRATIMAMMDEEKNKQKTPFEEMSDCSMDWLEEAGLDFDELKEMDEQEREDVMFAHDLDPSDYDFDD